MKFKTPITLAQLCETFQLSCPTGKGNEMVRGINEINRVESGDICFVDFDKYYKKTLSSEASFVIMPEETNIAHDKTVLIHENPFEVYNRIAETLYAQHEDNMPNQIADDVLIDGSCYIGQNVHIGSGSVIKANCAIHDGTVIGKNVIIESNTVIGGDAFYFHKSKSGKYTKWFSCGDVHIADNVSIGSVCTINRGVSSTTFIGEGSKLDCHIQIGHGVKIGKHCLIAAQVGISGKTIIGDHVSIYGQVGITQNISIGNHVKILAQSGVNDDIPDGETWFGSPAIPARQKMKEIFFLRNQGRNKK